MGFDDLIIGLINEPNIEIRRYIPDKLAKLGDWRSTKYLGSIMNDKNEPTVLRIECAESLGKQGNPEAVTHLKLAISSENIELKRTSLWSLGQIGTHETAEIVNNLRLDKNNSIKKWIIKSLGRIDNSICLEYLDDIVTQNFAEYQSLLNLIVISVTQQLRFADEQILSKWNNRCYEYILNFNDLKIHQACLILQNYCYKHKLVPNFSFFRDFLQTVSDNDNLLRPLILMNLAYTGEFNFLDNLPLDVHVVKALSKSPKQLKLIEILDQPNNYEPSIIEVVLKNLEVKFDCSKFLESDNEDIKYAALHYYAKKEAELELLLSAIKKGRRINFLLSLLQYFPVDSFEIIKSKALKGTKAERQTVIHLLENIDYIKKNRIIGSVLRLLEEISSTDRIWHIRRDARILKSKIIQLEKQ